ncbi:MAG TPA: hypothetical protein VEZ44_02810 [bacterium]|nr:hypothetical protein [bacterium]
MARYGAPLWMIADAVEKRGASQVVALRGYFIGLPVECVARVVLRAPASLEFVQILGTLRAFSGRCTLRSVEDGTEVLYRLEVDPGIPMISEDAARQFLVQFLERMLDRVKLASERKSPNRRAARGTATSTALPGQTAPEDEEPAQIAEAAGTAADAGKTREVPPAAARPVRRKPAPKRAAPRPERVRAEAAPAPERVPEPSQAESTAAPAGGPPSGRKRRRRRRRRRSEGGAAAGPATPSGG